MKLRLITIGSLACALVAHGQTHLASSTNVTSSSSASITVTGPGGSTSVVTVGPGSDVERILKGVEEELRKAMKNADGAARKTYDEAMRKLHEATQRGPNPPGVRHEVRVRSTTSADEAPALITTKPMSEAQRQEWQEDLRVMDKLLRDALADPGDDTRRVMGIRLWVTGRNEAQAAYFEDYGAVFSYEVDWSLARASRLQAEVEPAKPSSRWEEARRELRAEPKTNAFPWPMLGNVLPFQRPPLPHDPARLKALDEAVAAILAEAKNFRHLADFEFVVVTIRGRNDAGEPVRLTYRARKEDIDAAAAGKLKPEEFAKRIARHVG